MNWTLESAQATRTDRRWRTDPAGVMAAAAAAEEVTGCRVKPGSVSGDISLVNMTLDCRME